MQTQAVAKLTSKCQATVPEPIRKVLGRRGKNGEKKSNNTDDQQEREKPGRKTLRPHGATPLSLHRKGHEGNRSM
ncbi:MAG: hypothetical protein HY039_13085 [Nitrospirae bacterium]|nr:hypothetical protein [Nitrospirota bacterium]